MEHCCCTEGWSSVWYERRLKITSKDIQTHHIYMYVPYYHAFQLLPFLACTMRCWTFEIWSIHPMKVYEYVSRNIYIHKYMCIYIYIKYITIAPHGWVWKWSCCAKTEKKAKLLLCIFNAQPQGKSRVWLKNECSI